jgi:diaminopimelate epimerase
MATRSILSSLYTGCGNDFLIIDNSTPFFPLEDRSAIQQLCCSLKQPVDGLIIVAPSKRADFLMRFFNRDGSHASMCGNGVRALARFVRDKLAFTKAACKIEIEGRIIETQNSGETICVNMGKVHEKGWNLEFQFEDHLWIFHYLDSGVPHIVTFTSEVEHVDVAKVGAYFRHHDFFAPFGVNVNFVDPVKMTIRTFERGVEAETGACGTGAVASAWALHALHHVRLPIRFQVRSGQTLEVNISGDNAFLSGGASWLADVLLSFDSEKKSFSLSAHATS